MMGSTREKRALARLLQDNIIHLCKVNGAIYGGQFELDGIICLTGQKEGQELTVRIHERFGSHWSKYPSKPEYDVDRENNNSHMNFLKGIPPGMHNAFLTGQHGFPSTDQTIQPAHGQNEYESDMLDLSMNSSRNRDNERSNEMIYRHSPNKRIKPETPGHDYRNGGENELEIHRSCNTSPSVGGDDQAENLSISATNSEDGTSVTSSPDKATYLGKSPYLSSPFHLQKKTPLKTDRWTPSTPLPTVPECRQCGFSFDNFEVLSEHNEAVHSVFTCQHCHKTFTSRSNLERHARLHTGFKPYVCAICQKAFSRKDHLSNHSAKHAYKCGHCNKRYADKPNLATHFTYEHDSILTNCCEFCNKGFGNLESYEEHVKTHPQYHAVHKTYHPTGSSNRHVTSSPSPKKYACESCKFVSQDRITLIKHRLIHFEGQRCYTCLSCAKVFDDPLTYDEHLLVHHGEPNVFECCICRQIFQTLDILKRHELVHLNDDLNELMTSIMPCPHCDKVFRGISSLQEHIMMHNNQAKSHRCLFCNLGFNTYSELCRHMDELRHYPPDPRMLFGMTMGAGAFDPRKYTEFMAKRNLQKELQAGRPVSMETENKVAKPDTNNHNNFDENNRQDGTNSRTNNDEPNRENNEKRQELENDIGSDIEVVEPEAPEDTNLEHSQASISENSSYQFVVTENKSSVIEIKPEENQSNHSGTDERDSRGHQLVNGGVNTVGEDYSNLGHDERSNDTCTKSDGKPEENGEGNDPTQLKVNDRARKRKGPSPEKYVDGGEPLDMSVSEYYDNYDMESINSEASNPPSVYSSMLQSYSAAGSPVENGKPTHHRVIDRKPREGSKTSPAKISFDIPTGPHTCSVCQMTLSNFQALEQHCFAEHNRCPCMFCPKTFAQKANRDRHICLHTGDKPYACPECGEKFSRGDKLKLHRVRTHNIPTAPSTQFTLKRDPSASNSSNWSIHSPQSANHSDSADGWSNVVHGAGEWSMIPETSY